MTPPLYYGATIEDLRSRLAENFVAGLAADGASRGHLYTQPGAQVSTLSPQVTTVLEHMLGVGEREVNKQVAHFDPGESAYPALRDHVITFALYHLYKRQGYTDRDNPYVADMNRAKSELNALQQYRLGADGNSADGIAPIGILSLPETCTPDYPAYRRRRMGL